jgi:hypothetical protein
MRTTTPPSWCPQCAQIIVMARGRARIAPCLFWGRGPLAGALLSSSRKWSACPHFRACNSQYPKLVSSVHLNHQGDGRRRRVQEEKRPQAMKQAITGADQQQIRSYKMLSPPTPSPPAPATKPFLSSSRPAVMSPPIVDPAARLLSSLTGAATFPLPQPLGTHDPLVLRPCSPRRPPRGTPAKPSWLTIGATYALQETR